MTVGLFYFGELEVEKIDCGGWIERTLGKEKVFGRCLIEWTRSVCLLGVGMERSRGSCLLIVEVEKGRCNFSRPYVESCRPGKETSAVRCPGPR